MWPIKTNKERYNEYMKSILQLKQEVKQLESEKKQIDSEILNKEWQIEELKERAKHYEPGGVSL